MAASVLVDAGFLVAILTDHDTNHRWAITVSERCPPPWVTCEAALSEAFYLAWGTAQPVGPTRNGQPPLVGLECTISYWTGGSPDMQGVDRGRVMAQLDGELLAICSPPFTGKYDYSQTPPVALGTNLLWTLPDLRLNTQLTQDAPRWTVMGSQLPGTPPGSVPAVRLQRAATLTIFFYPQATF